MGTSLKLELFDIARAFGMIYIIMVWHLTNYTSMISLVPFGTYVTYGVLGMFMFISGWLLNDKYAVSEKIDIKRFAKKRILRLMPLYLLALLAFYFSGGISMSTLLLSLVGLSSFFPPQPPTLWFVSLIIDFYLLFPLLSYRKHHFSEIVFCIVYLVIMTLSYMTPDVDKRFLIYFPCFYAGILFNRYRLLRYLLKWQVLVCSVIVFCCCISLGNVIGIKFLRLLNTSLIALSFMNIIIFISHALTYLPVSRICTWIAYSSMAAYMFHRQIIAAFRRLSIWPDDGIGRLLFMLLICYPVILVSGYLIQLLYDSVTKKIVTNKQTNN